MNRSVKSPRIPFLHLVAGAVACGLTLLPSQQVHAQNVATAIAVDTGNIQTDGGYSFSGTIYIEGFANSFPSFSVLDFAAGSFAIPGTVLSVSNATLQMSEYNGAGTHAPGPINFYITTDGTDTLYSGTGANMFLSGTDPAFGTFDPNTEVGGDPSTGFADGLALGGTDNLLTDGTAEFQPYYLLGTGTFTSTAGVETTGQIDTYSLPLSGTALAIFTNALNTSGTIRILAVGEDPTGAIYAEYDSIAYASYPTLTFNYTSSLNSLNWVGGTATWNNTISNWYSGLVSGTWNSTAQADFVSGATPGTVTLGAPITANGVKFAVGGYTIAGATARPLTLSGTTAGDNFIITSDTSAASTISAVLSGSLGIVKQGPGILVLSGDDTYTGGLTLTSGTLQVANDGSFGNPAGSITLAGGGISFPTGFTVSSGRALSGAVGTFNIGPGQNVTYAGPINFATGHSSTLTLANSGTLTLSGTAINLGTVVLSASSSLVLANSVTSTAHTIFQADGTVYINGDDSGYGGGFQVDRGSGTVGPTLVVPNSTALGTTQMYLNAGTIKATAALTGTSAIATPVSFSGTTSFVGADVEWSGNWNLFYETYPPNLRVNNHMTIDSTGELDLNSSAPSNIDIEEQLIKTGTGTLTLDSGANQMADLQLLDGTIEVGPTGNLGTGGIGGTAETVAVTGTNHNVTLLLDNNAAVDSNANLVLTSTNGNYGLVDLNFDPSLYDLVSSLTVNGVAQPDGIYNSSNLPGFLTGGGNLVVSAGGFVQGFIAWQLANFPANFPNQAIAGATANPAGDGVSNLMKYALYLNPNAPIVQSSGSNGLPVATLQSGTLSITYLRLYLPPDITYQTETSTDLVNWSPTGVTSSLGATVDGITQVETDSIAVSGSVGFLRLFVMENSSTLITATDPVGFETWASLGNSDTRLSVPFTRPPEFRGGVTSVSGSNVLVVSSSANWATNQFVYSGSSQPKTYYALIGPNTSGTTGKQGSMYMITANTANTLTVALSGTDSVSTVTAGTQISVIPYWTMASVYPSSASGVSFTPSTSSLSRHTQVYIPLYSAVGINNPPTTIYYYLTNGTNNGWRQVGQAVGADHSNDVLQPNGFFIVRNGATDLTGTLTTMGSVYTGELTAPLIASGTTAQDNFVSIQRPVAYTLSQSGLISSGAFKISTSSLSRNDQLYIYDNTATAINKTPLAIYYFLTNGTNNGWRQVGQPVGADFSAAPLPAGSGFMIRKSIDSGGTKYWTSNPTY